VNPLPVTGELIMNLATALGIGLLVGAERERRKGDGTTRAAAGIRTFATTSLLGAVSAALGGALLLGVALLCVAGLAAAGYLRSHEQDPGLTTETSLVLTLLLGGLAMRDPAIAAGLGVTLAILLAARTAIHHFVRDILSESELHDALVLAAATLVIYPLVPDQYLGPFDALNPRTIWRIVIVIMSISAAGHVAIRAFGPKVGLPLTGLASGFVSSAATISAMGTRAVLHPALRRPAVAGAVLSTVATVLLLTAILATTSRPALMAMLVPLVCSGATAILYGLLFMVRIMRQDIPASTATGKAFSLKTAIGLAAALAVVLVISRACNEWFGETGLIAATAIAGFADAHAPSASVAALVAGGKLSADGAVIPILAAVTTNTITKGILAVASGGRTFGMEIVPGLVLVIAAAWAGLLLAG
jgi:uncharacterized membrane protein (DUF4010 family)